MNTRCLSVLGFCFLSLLGSAAGAQEAVMYDTLTNPHAGQPIRPRLAPGMFVRLPDGRRTKIAVQLPDGSFRTEEGVVISPAGVAQGFDVTEPVGVLDEAPVVGPATPLAELERQAEAALEKNPQEDRQAPGQPESKQAEPAQAETAIPVPDAAPTPPLASPEEGKDTPLTLAELIPLTPIPGKNAPTKPETPKEKQKAPKKDAQKPEKNVPQEKAKETPKKEKAQSKKPRIGEELSIPPEAAKTGNLDFLEGCWQGTRPEYYSKRIVKECFCFGARGKSGKRRIIDPLGGRNCIGAARANLSPASVLSFSSEGAPCDDGARWGQAEMVCRGSGEHTPCSWLFEDAEGGRQSYEISFVRVQSCGGR